MRIDLPELKRCCFCIPLRYGLLVWAYIKLISTLIMLSSMLYVMLILCAEQHSSWSGGTFILMAAIVISLHILEVIPTIVFVVGAHKKSIKLLKIYYYYMIANLVVFIATASTSFGRMMYNLNMDAEYAYILINSMSSILLNIVLQMYVLLLVRSEILKLGRNCQLEFVNYTSELTTKSDAVVDQLTHVYNVKSENDEV